jgi:2'-5' RNA ligase
VPADGDSPRNGRPETARVFFALWPPAAGAERLGGIARATAAAHGGRATRAETIHLTLAFVGDVAEASLPALVDAAAGVRGQPFDLCLDRLGFWTHNRLCWAGASAPPAALAELAHGLRAALHAAGFAVERERGAFVPHVTLVRKVGTAVPAQPIRPAVAWPCAAFVLVRSRLSAGGSAYQELHEFPLAP